RALPSKRSQVRIRGKLMQNLERPFRIRSSYRTRVRVSADTPLGGQVPARMRVIQVRGNGPTQLGGGGAAYPRLGLWRLASSSRSDEPCFQRWPGGLPPDLSRVKGTSDVGSRSCSDLDRAACGLRDDALARADPRRRLRAVLPLGVEDEVVCQAVWRSCKHRPPNVTS